MRPSPHRLAEAYRRGAQDTVKDLCGIVLERGSEVIEEEAMDRGDLLASGEIEVEKDRPVGYVRWTSEHAKYVHWGTRPHWPPLAPILAWVRRNLARFETTQGETVDVIRPSAGLSGGRARKSPDSAVMRVARAIQAKIAREGTAPVPFASKGAAEANRRANAILKANIEARMRR